MRKKESEKNKKGKVAVTNSDFALLIFFPLSLLVTAILPEARLGCTEAYFEK